MTRKKAAAKQGPARKAPAKPRAPAYSPTPGETELVAIARCVDVSEDAMMTLVGGGRLTREQFREAFAVQLEHGSEIIKVRVMSSLFIMAMSRSRGLAPTSAIFLAKALGGLSDGSGGVGGLTANVKVKGGGGDGGAGGSYQVVDVSFRIGDDSAIKDDDA